MQEYEILRDQQVGLLHHALEGQARYFFFEHIQYRLSNLGEAYRASEERFDSENMRAQTRAFLDTQSVASIREEFICSLAPALDKAY